MHFSTADLLQGTKAVSSAGTPVKLAARNTFASAVVIQARKSPTDANTGNVYIGASATPGQNLLVLVPGDSAPLQAPEGTRIDLSKIYVDAATSADAVTFTYL